MAFTEWPSSKPSNDLLQFHHENPPWHAPLPAPIAVERHHGTGGRYSCRGGVAKTADPGVVLQCRSTHAARDVAGANEGEGKNRSFRSSISATVSPCRRSASWILVSPLAMLSTSAVFRLIVHLCRSSLCRSSLSGSSTAVPPWPLYHTRLKGGPEYQGSSPLSPDCSSLF